MRRGNFQPFGNGRGGDGVRRRNDRAQHESGGERQVHEIMREIGDGHGGEQNQANGEQRDGAEICPEITPRGEQRRRKQKWRQTEQKDQFRIEPDFRKPGNQAKQQAADHEQDGIGNEHFASQQRQNGDRQQTAQQRFQQCSSCRVMRLGRQICTARLLAKGNNRLTKKYLTVETSARAGSAWQAVWVKSTLRV